MKFTKNDVVTEMYCDLAELRAELYNYLSFKKNSAIFTLDNIETMFEIAKDKIAKIEQKLDIMK